MLGTAGIACGSPAAGIACCASKEAGFTLPGVFTPPGVIGCVSSGVAPRPRSA